MPPTRDLAAPTSLLFGWLAATVALPAALVIAVAGQGLGALAGGCRWIGVSIPIGRQVWALVDQPALDFATRPSALGYWLGSFLLPMALIAALLLLHRNPRSLAAGLASVQLAWAAAAQAAWLPLLDLDDGHLARWLYLHDQPRWLVWTAPAAAGVAAVPVALRLLAVARAARPHLGRWLRLGLVTAYLLLPTAAWIGLATILAGAAAARAGLAVAPLAAGALVVSFLFYPPHLARPLRELGGGDVLRCVALVVPLAGLLWIAGRPLPGERWAGSLWDRPRATNNIRPWIAARPLPWLGHTAGQNGNRGGHSTAIPVPEREKGAGSAAVHSQTRRAVPVPAGGGS